MACAACRQILAPSPCGRDIPLKHNKMRQPLPFDDVGSSHPSRPLAWDPMSRSTDDVIEDLLLTLANAGLTPFAVHCVQTLDGPLRLSNALRLVFGLAVSVRQERQLTDEQWEHWTPWLQPPASKSESQWNHGKTVNVNTSAQCREDPAQLLYADSLLDMDRWVERNFNASSHGFLARGKTEDFSEDCRSFTKRQKGRRLSLVSENQVHHRGTVCYIIAFTAGDLSRADGVGIIFSQGLPRSSDIQKIISVFLNRTGRICSRINQRVTRLASSLPQIEVGDILEVVNNMDMYTLTFTVWAKAGTEFRATISYSEVAIAMGFEGKPVPGHLAVVVKNPGVSVSLFS